MGKAKWFVLAVAAAAVSVALICGEAARQQAAEAFVPYGDQTAVQIRALNTNGWQAPLVLDRESDAKSYYHADLVIENNRSEEISVHFLRASIDGVCIGQTPKELRIQPGAREIASIEFAEIPKGGGTLTCLLDAKRQNEGVSISYSVEACSEGEEELIY